MRWLKITAQYHNHKFIADEKYYSTAQGENCESVILNTFILPPYTHNHTQMEQKNTHTYTRRIKHTEKQYAHKKSEHKTYCEFEDSEFSITLNKWKSML